VRLVALAHRVDGTPGDPCLFRSHVCLYHHNISRRVRKV
jgi:hypothetical protein